MLSNLIRKSFSLINQFEQVGIKNKNILRNLSIAELYEYALAQNKPADYATKVNSIADNGALIAYSGIKTGRSPKDKRIVSDAHTKNDIWWGEINIPIEQQNYRMLEEIAINYLNNRSRIYVIDGYAGWDPLYRLKVRIYCTRAYHALFMRNMLIVPTEEELQNDFNKIGPDYNIFNAGELKAPSQISNSKTSVALDLTDKRMTILGTQYAGEMKKGVFSVMHYLMPKKNILSMHCSATQSKIDGNTTLLFGLSGTGKTTLSADPNRYLIGDDEHCWSDQGIFNIEGGCYAKCLDLSEQQEPDIYRAIHYGAVLENVNFHDKTRVVNYSDNSITENTRASYPLQHIPNAKFPAMASHPKNIIFLTCDSFGVLPPVSKLTQQQAMYHFISGYTSKVAGTEIGIKEPQSTFSSCFGAAFLPLHPIRYAELLEQKMKQFQSNAWLVNTGWSGGKYGEGKRMNLKITRAIINAIHSGELQNAEYEIFPVFNFQIPKNITDVPSNLLNPKNTWNNKADYDVMRNDLAKQFQDNFVQFKGQESESIENAGPKF